MAFDVGDKVVYPHHGAAVVERREMKEVFGETKEYLVLRLAYGDLTLMVPADNTDEVGLREVINGRSSTTRRSKKSSPSCGRKMSACPQTGLGGTRTTWRS
jgi:RNA polymerase-interacting CarD/CdnL/TRCF family regulator